MQFIHSGCLALKNLFLKKSQGTQKLGMLFEKDIYMSTVVTTFMFLRCKQEIKLITFFLKGTHVVLLSQKVLENVTAPAAKWVNLNCERESHRSIWCTAILYKQLAWEALPCKHGKYTTIKPDTIWTIRSCNKSWKCFFKHIWWFLKKGLLQGSRGTNGTSLWKWDRIVQSILGTLELI